MSGTDIGSSTNPGPAVANTTNTQAVYAIPGSGVGPSIEASGGTALVSGDVLEGAAATIGTPGSGSAVVGFMQLDGNGNAVGNWIPRTNTLAALEVLAGNAGELASATDQAAIVQFTGTANQGAVYFPTVVKYFGSGSTAALATVVPSASGNVLVVPNATGANSIAIQTGSTITTGNYSACARGQYDIVISTGAPSQQGTLAGGSGNVVISANVGGIALGSAPNGSTSTENVLINGAVLDGYSNQNVVVGAGGASNAKATAMASSLAFGPTATLAATSGGLPSGTNTGSFNVAVGYNVNMNFTAGGSTLALPSTYDTVVGSLCNMTGGAMACTIIGFNNNLNPTTTHVSDDAALYGMGLQDGSMVGVMRVGTSQITGAGNGPEAIIDFVPDGSGSNNVNNNLILLGSAKQYGDLPLMGNASSRGTLTGGRGANVGYQFALADQGYVAVAPTTGTTVTIPNGCSTYCLNPTGTLAALTVNMPANPIDGQFLTLESTQTVTTLTQSGNGNTLLGGLTTISATTPARWRFNKSGATANAPSNTWTRTV